MVEVLVRDHAVVYEEELDAALDGDNAALDVYEPDVGVGGEDFGECGVDVVADGGSEVFDRGEATVGWGSGNGDVVGLLRSLGGGAIG